MCNSIHTYCGSLYIERSQSRYGSRFSTSWPYHQYNITRSPHRNSREEGICFLPDFHTGVAVLCGFLVDLLYVSLGISAVAIVRAHSEVLLQFVSLAPAIILLLLTIQSAILFVKNEIFRKNTGCDSGSYCGT